jgi:hypothetical protein
MFKKNNLVLLIIKNLKLKVPERKLIFYFIKPFKVAEAIKTQTYCLHLPTVYIFHNMFNVSHLKLFHAKAGSAALKKMPAAIIIKENKKL